MTTTTRPDPDDDGWVWPHQRDEFVEGFLAGLGPPRENGNGNDDPHGDEQCPWPEFLAAELSESPVVRVDPRRSVVLDDRYVAVVAVTASAGEIALVTDDPRVHERLLRHQRRREGRQTP